VSELRREEAKDRTRKAIEAIEAKTSAEIVVVMRRASGSYLHADLLFGALSALALLCVFLYHPEPFDFTWFPLEQSAAFVAGAVLSAHVPPLRRALVPRSWRGRNVETAARAAFVEKGVSKKRTRTGLLVYVSAFEHDAFVVADVGLDEDALGEPFARAREAIRSAARAGSVDDFVASLERLGERLAELHPHRPGDKDELADEVAA
jgi:putative membrane protein